MEDLAASIMTLSGSAPLYLFFEVPAFQKHHEEELLHYGGGSFEFAVATGEKDVDEEEEEDSGATPRACASDVSAYADELFRGGVLLPLKLPPRLQRPAAASFSCSAATSPTGQQLVGRTPSWSPFASSRRHRGFDPFAAALEKVSRDGAAPAPRRARSLSPLRGATAAAGAARSSRSRPAGTAAATQKASASPPWRRRRGGVQRFLCRASGATTQRRRRGNGAPCRSGLLVCFGL